MRYVTTAPNDVNPLNVVHLYGEPYDMGFAMGTLFKNEVAAIIPVMFQWIGTCVCVCICVSTCLSACHSVCSWCGVIRPTDREDITPFHIFRPVVCLSICLVLSLSLSLMHAYTHIFRLTFCVLSLFLLSSFFSHRGPTPTTTTTTTPTYIHTDTLIGKYLKKLPDWLAKLIEQYGSLFLLDLTYNLTLPFQDSYFTQELRGLADGSGADFQALARLAM
jgi:hypothetical protein